MLNEFAKAGVGENRRSFFILAPNQGFGKATGAGGGRGQRKDERFYHHFLKVVIVQEGSLGGITSNARGNRRKYLVKEDGRYVGKGL